MTDERPFISVVLITYNTAALVEQAIASVQAQTFTDIELIVVDDGSTDDTPKRLQGRPGLTYLRTANGGIPSARNHGIAASRGRWIALMDSDDVWRPEKLELQAAVARDPRFAGCGLIFTDFDKVHDGRVVIPAAMRTGFPLLTDCGYRIEEVLRRRERIGDVDVLYGMDFLTFFHGNCVLPSSAMFRADLIQRSGPFDLGYRAGGEESDFFLRLAAITDLACIDRPLVDYTVGRPGQLTALETVSGMVVNDIRLRREFLAAHPELLARHPAVADEIFGQIYARLGRLQVGLGQAREARVSFKNARRHHPLHGRTVLFWAVAQLPGPLMRALLRLRASLKRIAKRSK